MRYIINEERFYAAWDAMVLLYTRYPTITPVIEEQIEHDLIAYLEAHGAAYESDCVAYELDYISAEDDLILVDPQTIAPLILQDVKEVLQHD